MALKGFINGKNIFLRKLLMEDASEEYLSWLNDPEVLKYRTAKAYPSSMEDLQNYLKNAQISSNLYFAICLKANGKHIGGISLDSIDYTHRTAEISIMIGDKKQWGKGYGIEAVKILTKHAFDNMNLNKLWAQSANPVFNSVVKKLGWKIEGTLRQMFWIDGEYVDWDSWSILQSEFYSLNEIYK